MSSLSYYWNTIRQALKDERQRTAGRLVSSEPDFLPAALEVIDRPVSPTWRITSWALMIGFALTIGWLFVGHIDIVASAPGRVIPIDSVKLVQASNEGIVRRIFVHEGDPVVAGQPLIDLDPTVSTADETQAEKALLSANIDVARQQAIVDALSGKPVNFIAPPGTPPEVALTQRALVAAQVAEAKAEAGSLGAARDSALSDAKAAEDQISKYEETGPILDREVGAMTDLEKKGYAPGLQLLELQRQRRSEMADHDVAQATRARGLSDARKFGMQATQSREQARQSALSDLAKAQTDAILRHEEVVKAQRRSHLQRLVAPVDGTVQQISVHTVGGVVEPVKSLMVVVPNGALLAEVRIQNKDAGFVKAGQSAVLKFDAFPFTRYGTVKGRIISVSRDAVQPDRGSAYFIARIVPAQNYIANNEERVALTAGLELTADIKLGSRRIIDYIISPIRETGSEAAREK